jgi:hypothetical protein
MAQKSYYEKLKDPRWQKKRLKIMERDGFCCTLCYDKDKPLNVHHSFYIKNKNPWDYDDRILVTICESCHKNLKNNTNRLNYQIRKAGEFAPFDFFKDLFILFNPFSTNKEKYISLSNIMVNMYFHDSDHRYCKIFMSFMEKLKKEISKENG